MQASKKAKTATGAVATGAAAMEFGDAVQELGPLPNNKVIDKYIEFVNKKSKIKNCTPATVVDDFCEVIKDKLKTKKITPNIIMKLVDDMNAVAEAADKTSQRKWVINEILKMFGGAELADEEVSETRDWFTPKDESLTKATMEQAQSIGRMYDCRHYEGCKKSNHPYPPDNIELSRQFAHSKQWIPRKKKPTEYIINIERKHCANCWMCANPIYVYKITVDTGNIYYDSCGEDEHVLPPGWGNILGILWSDLTDQRMYNKCPSSLSPSHTWCNQLKNDELILLLPRFTGSPKKYHSFQINDEGFNRFVTKGIDWSTNGKKIEDHNMFYKGEDVLQNGLLSNKEEQDAKNLMNKMKTTMTIHLNGLIKEMQDITTSATITTDHYIVFMLRTTLMLGYIWNKIMTKRSEAKNGVGIGGGKTQKGGALIDFDDLLVGIIYDPIIKFRNETHNSNTETTPWHDAYSTQAFDDTTFFNDIFDKSLPAAEELETLDHLHIKQQEDMEAEREELYKQQPPLLHMLDKHWQERRSQLNIQHVERWGLLKMHLDEQQKTLAKLTQMPLQEALEKWARKQLRPTEQQLQQWKELLTRQSIKHQKMMEKHHSQMALLHTEQQQMQQQQMLQLQYQILEQQQYMTPEEKQQKMQQMQQEMQQYQILEQRQDVAPEEKKVYWQKLMAHWQQQQYQILEHRKDMSPEQKQVYWQQLMAQWQQQMQHEHSEDQMQHEHSEDQMEMGEGTGEWLKDFDKKSFMVYVYGIEQIILAVYDPQYIKLPSLDEQMVEPLSTRVDTSWPVQQAIFGQGGKHKSQKYKSRKYKSQKYKTRKHKSQKQKNRKKHKSRKHK